jgi:transposase-like protein
MPKKAAKKSVPRRKFTPAQKQKYVAEAERTSVPATAAKHKLSDALLYKWKKQLASAAAPPASAPKPRKRRKTRTRSTKLVEYAKTNHLEAENQQLRNMVVDQLLIIKELQNRS